MKTAYKITFSKKKRWSDPRHIQIDIDFPVVDTSEILGVPNSNRVMPLNKMGKFFSLLKQSTKTFKDADISHFWVSGYIQLDFYLHSLASKAKLKGLVKQAIDQSGGFMTLQQWHDKHNSEKKRTKIFSFSGTGSNIKGGQINTGYEYL